jgi:hypothetical protein
MAYMPINPVGGGQQADPLSGLVAQEMGQSDILNQGYQNFLQSRNLAQNQSQFEAGLAEQARQREHDMGQMRFGAEMQAQENQARRLFESDQATLDRKFRVAEREEMQKWEMSKFATEQRLTLRLAQINALKEQAIASGQAEAIAAYDKEIQVIEDDRAKNASQLAIAKKAYETGTTDINTLYADFNRTIQQKIAAAELANTQGNEFAKPALQAFLEEGSTLSQKQLDVLSAQQAFESSPAANAALPEPFRTMKYLMAQGLTEEQARVASRNLSGLQYLNLKPGASIIGGIDFARQASANFVESKKTADEVAQLNRGMLSKAIAQQFGNLPGAANINPQKVEQALQMIMVADESNPANREQALTMLAQSGASPDVLDTLLNQMSMDLMDQTTRVSDQLGSEAGVDPEDSLIKQARIAQQEGLKDAAAQLRKARRYLGTTNVTSLRNVVMGLDVAKQSGQVGDLLRTDLRSVGLDPTRLERGYAGQRAALADIDSLNLLLENLDRKYRTAERMGAQRVTVAPKVAASAAELAAIRALIDELGGGME